MVCLYIEFSGIMIILAHIQYVTKRCQYDNNATEIILSWMHRNPYRLCDCLLTVIALNYCSMGLDLLKGEVRDNLKAGVIEPAMSKVKIIQVPNSRYKFSNIYRINLV